MDPIVVALAGVVSTVSGVLYLSLIQRAERCEKDAQFWRDKFFAQLGLTDLAIEEAEKRSRRSRQ